MNTKRIILYSILVLCIVAATVYVWLQRSTQQSLSQNEYLHAAGITEDALNPGYNSESDKFISVSVEDEE